MEIKDNRQNQCLCGSKIFYREGDYIHCAMSNCNNQLPARREKDKDIPSISELKKNYE